MFTYIITIFLFHDNNAVDYHTQNNVLGHIRCEIPPEVKDYVRVTSWLHEEGTAIEIFPEKVRF